MLRRPILACSTLAALLAGGCGLVLDFGEGADGGVDAAGVDAGGVDSAGPPQPCEDGWIDDGVFAVYRFDGDLTESTGGGPDGAAGREGTDRYRDGPAGCRRALDFDGSRYFVAIPHVDAWDDVGSIDFWLYAPLTTTSEQGILSRDANFQEANGHLSVVRAPSGWLGVRVQRADPETPPQESICGEPTDISRWMHVGINVAAGQPLELWLDGIPMDVAAGSIGNLICGEGSGVSPGVAGNTNPWVLGAGTWRAPEGAELSTEAFFEIGAIDHLRFSSARRDFSAAAP